MGVTGMVRRSLWMAAAAAAAWLCGGFAVAGELSLGNGKLSAAAKPGTVVLTTNGAGAKGIRVELALCGAGGGAAGVDRIESKGAGIVRIAGGGVEADLTLGKDKPFLTVTPAKPGGFLEVRIKSRYAVLPDYFGYDVVYDPPRFKSNTLLVPAENFLLHFPEGNRAIVMCVWPGGLTNAKGAAGEAAGGKPAGRDPTVRLVLEGDGAARRVAASRIELVGGPVHVAVLERDNIWYDQDVASCKAREPMKLEWKRPFDAHWRLDTLVADGKTSADYISRSQSYRFLYAPATKERPPRPPAGADIEDKRAWEDTMKIWEKDYPVVSEERMYPIYPAWFRAGDTYIALHDNPKNKTPENVYDRILIYLLDRDPASPEQTPMDVLTFVDIMRETLGQEPCAYVLDLEGVKGRGRGTRGPGGDQKVMNDATCTIWRDLVINFKSKSPEEQKTFLIQGFKDMGTFLHAVADRIEEYRQFNERLLKYVAENGGRAGPTAQRVGGIAEAMKTVMAEYERKGKIKEGLAFWDQEIPKHIAKIEAGDFKDWEKGTRMRELGQQQDNQVSDCRRYVKAIRQEASFTDSTDPEAQKFMVGVRDMCQEILRNPHPKELLLSDPNSARIGLPLEKR